MRAQNHNQGKPRWALLHKDTPHAMLETVKLAEQGIEKYSRDNFTQSMGTPDAERFLEESLESIMRHTIALMNGEQIDAETGRHHGACIMRRASFSIEYWAHDKQANEILDMQTGDVSKKESRYDWSKAPADAVCAYTDRGGTKHFSDRFLDTHRSISHIAARPE